MPTKEEYSSLLNKLFLLDLDWTRMKKEDLAQFAVQLTHPEVFLENLGVSSEVHKEESQKQFGFLHDAMDELRDTWPGPLAKGARALRKFVEDKDN